jgi:hypothetical protein
MSAGNLDGAQRLSLETAAVLVEESRTEMNSGVDDGCRSKS